MEARAHFWQRAGPSALAGSPSARVGAQQDGREEMEWASSLLKTFLVKSLGGSFRGCLQGRAFFFFLMGKVNVSKAL